MDEETVYYRPETGNPHIFVISGGEVSEYMLAGEQILGRPYENITPSIPVHSGVVSRKHGRFVTDLTGAKYCDMGSTNGTDYNGYSLPVDRMVILNDGDVLRIHGKNDVNSELGVVIIYSTVKESRKQWFRLNLGDVSEVAIGRSEQLRLEDQSVSRRHASFFLAQNGWAVIDHGSTNGVFLNSARIGAPVYLKKNDVVRIAGYYFVFLGVELLCQQDLRKVEENTRLEQDPGGSGLSVWIEERNVWQRAKKKTLLRDIKLDIPSGNMVLILGGSGAGKTTFMNAVMGYERAEGSIKYDGTDIYREYESMKYEIGYVPQQDLLRMNDTVYDTLRNAARMRLPKMDETRYREHVEETLHLLGLDNLRDSLVGKLSGGQRKRLSIAVEYIGNPSLFFLDEPDSGLDGMMARRLMENLRTIADQGRIVMVISHSPDRAVDLFDKVIVLAKNSKDEGRLVFYGTPEDACRFFNVQALEGIMKRINYPEEGGEGLADMYIEQFERQYYN